MRKRYLKIYSLLLLVLLILLILVQIFLVTRNRRKAINSTIRVSFLLDHYDSMCRYRIREGYEFRLPACSQYELGWHYELVGRVTPPTDKSSFSYFPLDVSSFSQILPDLDSAFGYYHLFIHSLITFTVSVRESLIDSIKSHVGAAKSPLLIGLTLGSRFANFAPDFRSLIQLLGLSHMVAVSGFHLGVIFALVSGGLSIIPFRRLVLYAIIFMLAWYSLLVSTPLSVLRALFMLIIALIGRNFFYKQTNSLFILFQVLLILCLISYFYLVDVGLILSFLSTLGILVFGGFDVLEISSMFGSRGDSGIVNRLLRLVDLIKGSILTSWSAQLTSLPVILVSFGSFAPLGFISSLVFSTLLGFLVSFGFPLSLISILESRISGLYYFLLPYFAFLDDIADLLIWSLSRFVGWFGFLWEPEDTPGIFRICVYYAFLLVFVCVCLVRRCRRRFYVG